MIQHRVHPRSRGGNDSFFPLLSCTAGPSPLTRGKRLLLGGEQPYRGSIPAHAGETCSAMLHPWLLAVHPRSRGGNYTHCSFSLLFRGPSPLTRGKRQKMGVNVRGYGSIPAHAGETVIGDSANARIRVHPRSRGGNTWPGSAAAKRGGPSPLTRGKPGLSAVMV